MPTPINPDDDDAIETILEPPTPTPAPVLSPAAMQGPFGIVPAPFQFLVTGEDNLRLTVWNSRLIAEVQCSGRFLKHTGDVIPFRFTLTPTTDRIATTRLFPLGHGALLNVTVGGRNSASMGSTFARLDVVRGFTGAIVPLGVLVQAYVGAYRASSWPGAVLEDSARGEGEILAVVGTNPAAGAEISEECPLGARWRIVGLRARLATDATAANRRPSLVWDDGIASQFARLPSSAVVGASSTQNFLWNLGVTLDPSITDVGQAALPLEHVLVNPYRIRTVTTNLQAGDDWTAPELFVREWLEAFES